MRLSSLRCLATATGGRERDKKCFSADVRRGAFVRSKNAGAVKPAEGETRRAAMERKGIAILTFASRLQSWRFLMRLNCQSKKQTC